MINEESNGFIRPSQGICQRDPLSPYNFIICMAVLSHRLCIESNQIKSGLDVKLSHHNITIPGLFFADDYLLFCKINGHSWIKLKALLDSFCSASGQLINLHKSVLTFSGNACTTQKCLATSIFHIPQWVSLGKYLGCPVFQGRPSNTTFQQSINKACSNLDG